jgi:hypothetical protein
MSVDGRPVFVLPGPIPMHRDLRPGSHGGDVRQLELALARLGFKPGPIDGKYDSATAAAVSSFYLRKGYDPFGPTEQQLEQLRSAESSAAAARDAYLQAVNAVAQARHVATPGEIAQARIDAATAREAIRPAELAVRDDVGKLAAARAAAAAAKSKALLAQGDIRSAQAAADAEVAKARADYDGAVADERQARADQETLAPDTTAAERDAAAAKVTAASSRTAGAAADLDAKVAAADQLRRGAPAAARNAREEAAQATRDVAAAQTELTRARLAVVAARSQASLNAQRVRALTSPVATGTLQAIAASAAQEAERTRAEVARLSAASGVQVPSDELLFFPTLPVRVDAVAVRRGAVANGHVMDVTNSRLSIDSALTIQQAARVHPGDPVTIYADQFNLTTQGTVARVATEPGTNKVAPDQVYMQVTPQIAPVKLVGQNVRLTIAFRRTTAAVLQVPVTAVSLGGDGGTRLQVRRDGRTVFVPVVRGLVSKNLVEVRPLGSWRLDPGDLVVVGNTPGAGK